jgi:hypothetical protein
LSTALPVVALLLLALAAAPAAAAASDGARWECRMRDAAGDCIGLSTYTQPDGTRLSGLRSKLGGEPGWHGLLVRYHPDGRRSECLADAEGRCQVQGKPPRDTRRDAARPTPAAASRALPKPAEPPGDRLDCERDARGACNGAATLWFRSGGRIQGRLVPGPKGQLWQGRLVHYYPGGDREECGNAPTGACEGETTYTYADGTRLQGRKVLRGEQSRWSGEVMQIFTSGKRMRCDAGREQLCEEDTQIPVDAQGKPLGRIPRSAARR